MGDRPLYWVANPLEGGTVLGFGIGLDDEVEIARRRAPADTPGADRARTSGGLGGSRIARAPGERRDCGICGSSTGKEGRRRITSIVHVSHDLVQSESRFLKRIHDLGFRPVLLLRGVE